jgi:hypothetical protein
MMAGIALAALRLVVADQRLAIGMDDDDLDALGRAT